MSSSSRLRKKSQFTIVSRDRDFNSVKTTTRSKIPRTRNLAVVRGTSGQPGFAGDIILNQSDNTFYGHTGNSWTAFNGSGGSGGGNTGLRATDSSGPITDDVAAKVGSPTGPDGMGVLSIAGGYNSTATSKSSIVIGANSSSTNSISSIVIGVNSSSSAYADYSVIIGDSISGYNATNAVVIGRSAAGGQNAVSIGGNAKSATGSVAIGYGSTGNGANFVAIGLNSSINSSNSTVAIGYNANIDINAENSVAIGFNATISENAENSVAIGTGVIATQPGGFFTNHRTVAGGSTATWIGDELVQDGASSRKYKEDITPLDEQGELIDKLNPVSFRYKPDYVDNQDKQIGFIAEEIHEVYPEFTLYKDGDPENVSYPKIVAVLTKELQTTRSRLQYLENIVEKILLKFPDLDE